MVDKRDCYIQGTSSQIQHLITPSGIYITPGYFYLYNSELDVPTNEEYYIFANPSGCAITSEDGNYSDFQVGSNFFVIDSETELFTMDDVDAHKYIKLDSDVYEDTKKVSWDYDIESNSYTPVFDSGIIGTYFVFDTETAVQISEYPLDKQSLVIDNHNEDEVYKVSAYTTWLTTISAFTIGIDVVAVVEDIYGYRLNGKNVIWYEITKTDTGLVGTALTTTVTVNGVARLDTPLVTSANSVYGVYLYAESEGVRSDVIHIDTNGSVQGKPTETVFELDNAGVIWNSAEASIALGVDIWNDAWTDTTNNLVSTELTEDGEPLTRGDWRVANPGMRRPPLSDQSDKIKSEPSGIYNAYDFWDDYDPSQTYASPSGFMEDKFIACNGFWGQVIITGYMLRTATSAQHQNCLNNSTESYTISYSIDDNGPNYDGCSVFGNKGSFDDVIADADLNLYYVLYVPNQLVRQYNTMPTQSYYFRGLAMFNFLQSGSNALSQKYTFSNLFSQAALIGD